MANDADADLTLTSYELTTWTRSCQAALTASCHDQTLSLRRVDGVISARI